MGPGQPGRRGRRLQGLAAQAPQLLSALTNDTVRYICKLRSLDRIGLPTCEVFHCMREPFGSFYEEPLPIGGTMNGLKSHLVAARPKMSGRALHHRDAVHFQICRI